MKKESFLTRIEKDENGCWIWQKCKHKQGYGTLTLMGKHYLAHRLAWEIFKDEIPKGLMVCHKCDVPSCCNPTHLFLGTQKDNMRDANQKKRMNGRKLGKRRNKLNWDQVQKIKKLHSQGMTRKELEQKFQVGQTCIAKILRGNSWNINWTKEL